MARPEFPRSVIEFQRRFPDHDACRAYLFASRWPDGFACPVCGGGEVGGEHRRHLWQCKACGRQTSVTAGTVMHKTHLPLTLLVLGRLPGRYARAGHLGAATAPPARDLPL